MKLAIFDLKNQKMKDRELPSQFSEAVRPDLIKRAVIAIHNNSRQAYGAFAKAGNRLV